MKAYEINFQQIDEGYCYSPEIAYAETRGKAKFELFNRISYAKNWNGDEVTFLNIPIRRCKEYDKILFEGDYVTKFKKDQIIKEREREDKLLSMLNNPEIKYCYVKKGSYYRPDSCGYTDFIFRAGVYTISEAVSHARHCKDITIIPIDIIKHNKMIQDEIDELNERLLK